MAKSTLAARKQQLLSAGLRHNELDEICTALLAANAELLKEVYRLDDLNVDTHGLRNILQGVVLNIQALAMVIDATAPETKKKKNNTKTTTSRKRRPAKRSSRRAA